MFRVLIKLFDNEDGATAIEYALIAVLISIVAVAIMQNMGSTLPLSLLRSPATYKYRFERRDR
jgi:Flp pilus assembly pilin Flp